MKARTAILMMNMGGPKNATETQPYLNKLFDDSELIQLPLKSILGPLIAYFRSGRLAKKYQLIGGGSPIFHWTEVQGKKMVEKLDEISPKTAPHKHFTAFRYISPSTEDAILHATNDGVERIILFSQYPQYSCTTSGSSINEAVEILNRMPASSKPKVSLIDRWYFDEKFIYALCQVISNSLESFPQEHRSEIPLIFTSHSIPIDRVKKGDIYSHEVHSTIHSVVSRLNLKNPYFIGWQSKVGFDSWLEPDTLELVESLIKSKRYPHGMLIVPVTFTSDHIETLYDIDLKMINHAKIKFKYCIKRTSSFNGEQTFIDALANVVKTHINNKFLPSSNFSRRCQNCVNPRCQNSRNVLANV